MDTLLFGVVPVRFLVIIGVSIIGSYCLVALFEAIVDTRWNRKKKE